MSTNRRLRRRIAAVAAALILPGSAVLLAPAIGHADEEPGGLVFQTNSTIAWEKGGPGGQRPLVVVRVSEVVKEPVTVVLDTADATATAPADYAAITGLVVTIPAGSASAEVPLDIVADAVTEPDEWFSVSLSKPSRGKIGKGTAIVLIKDGGPPAKGR